MAVPKGREKDKGDRPSGVADATSQAQLATGEPATPDNAPEKTARKDGVAGPEAEIQFFDGSVAKINADGNEVMSDHLAPGETLRRESDKGDRYAFGHHSDKAVALRADQDRQAEEERASRYRSPRDTSPEKTEDK